MVKIAALLTPLLAGLILSGQGLAVDAETLNQEGIELGQQGDVSGAISKFQAAIEADPSSANAHANLGLAFFLQRNFEQAIPPLEKAVELDESNCTAHYNLGLARENRGNLVGAIEDYSRAIECDPDHALAYQGRGYIRGLRLGISSEQGGINDLVEAEQLFQEQGDADQAAESRRMIQDICSQTQYTREGC